MPWQPIYPELAAIITTKIYNPDVVDQGEWINLAQTITGYRLLLTRVTKGELVYFRINVGEPNSITGK